MDQPAQQSVNHSLLSDSYRQLNLELHQREPMYGTTGRRYVDVVRRLAQKYRVRTILDYGCGKRDLWHSLHQEFDVRNFDPALPGLDKPPEPADLVAGIDVLEHVEPDYLEYVLADLARVTVKAGFLTIAMRPSLKRLADGTNCHRITENLPWWQQRLAQRFRLAHVNTPDHGNCIQVVVEPLRS